MRVADLEGVLLDYWVLRAEGWEDDRPQDMQMRRGGEYCVAGLPPVHAVNGYCWRSPSTDWAQGGPLIERERMTLEAGANYGGGNAYKAWLRNPDGFFHTYGPTLLAASMRAYVASKFGIDVPDSADDAPQIAG